MATILRSYGILFSLYQIVTDTKKKTDILNLKLTKHKCKLDQILKNLPVSTSKLFFNHQIIIFAFLYIFVLEI